jgi:hypothetical protein
MAFGPEFVSFLEYRSQEQNKRLNEYNFRIVMSMNSTTKAHRIDDAWFGCFYAVFHTARLLDPSVVASDSFTSARDRRCAVSMKKIFSTNSRFSQDFHASQGREKANGLRLVAYPLRLAHQRCLETMIERRSSQGWRHLVLLINKRGDFSLADPYGYSARSAPWPGPNQPARRVRFRHGRLVDRQRAGARPTRSRCCRVLDRSIPQTLSMRFAASSMVSVRIVGAPVICVARSNREFTTRQARSKSSLADLSLIVHTY